MLVAFGFAHAGLPDLPAMTMALHWLAMSRGPHTPAALRANAKHERPAAPVHVSKMPHSGSPTRQTIAYQSCPEAKMSRLQMALHAESTTMLIPGLQWSTIAQILSPPAG